MKKYTWINSTQPFENALKDVQSCYQDKLHTELDKALSGHEVLVSRLKNVEKTASAANVKLTKNIEQSELSDLRTAVTKLDDLLSAAEARLEDCIDAISDIEKRLPAKERLVSGSTSGQDHYSHIRNLMEKHGHDFG